MYSLVITKKSQILLIDGNTLVEKYENTENSLEGNIYLGKVQNVLPKLKGAFINIGEDKNALIHDKDIINNNKKLQPGEPLLVQIKKDSIGQKGARVTTDISLAGTYVVLLPMQKTVTVSNKITDTAEKNRLKSLVREYTSFGAIVRTGAENKEEEELKSEIEELERKWEYIQKQQNDCVYPKKLYESPEQWKQILTSLTGQIHEIITDDDNIYEEAIRLAKINVVKKEDPISYDIQKQIEKSCSRKIWLKCGGFIVIDKTEALIAIDINSGKYIGKKADKEFIMTVNKEATIEIAKQIKLRNLRGIIIIDYINMENEQKDEIQTLLEQKLKEDRAKTQIYGFSKLNLLELTRKSLNR